MASEISSGASSSQSSSMDREKKPIDSSAQGASNSNSVQPSLQESYTEIVNEWYVALLEEDSRRLQELLHIHPDLWEVGWEPDPKRKVKGRPRNYWNRVRERDWKGRTALHVGARRGNVDLLQNVLDLCRIGARAGVQPELSVSEQDSPVSFPTATAKRDNEDANLSLGSHPDQTRDEDAPEEVGSRRESNVKEGIHDSKVPLAILEDDDDGKERSMERLLLAKDGEYKLDAIAMAIVNGNQFVVAVLLEAGSMSEPVQSKYCKKLDEPKKKKGKKKLDEPEWYAYGSDVSGPDESKEDVHGLDGGGPDEPKKDGEGSAVGGSDEPKNDVHGSDVDGSAVGVSDEPKKDVDGSDVGVDELKKDVDGSNVGGSDEPKNNVHTKTRIDQKYWDLIHELRLSERTRQRIDILKENSVVKVVSEFGWNKNKDRRKVVMESEGQQDKARKTPHEQMLSKLRRATLGVIDNFRRDGLFRTFVLDRYDRHRDYNFLSKEEFLFHFLSTRYDSNESDHLVPHLHVGMIGRNIRYLYFVVQDAIMRAVVSTSSGLMHFLWTLHDGQGRPPLHVAVDEMSNPSATLLNLVRASAVDEKLVKEVMGARDGAGRTALHRSMALAGADFGKDSNLDYQDLKEKLERFVIDLRSKFLMDGLQRSHDHGKLEHEIDILLYDFIDNQAGEQRFGSESLLQHVATKIVPNWKRNKRACPAYDEAVRTLMIQRESRGRQTGTSRSGTSYSFDENAVSKAQGFTGIKGDRDECARAPLHTAIIHKRWVPCSQFIVAMQRNNSFGATLRSQRLECSDIPESRYDLKHVSTTVSALQLAAIVGDLKILTDLLQVQQDSSIEPYRYCSALQIAAALGKYDMLRLIKDKGHDPLELDQFGNSALHYALRGLSLIYDKNALSRSQKTIFSVHLTDYINCEEILKAEKERKRNADERRDRESVKTDEIVIEKERCINMLIQEGCDIFKPNYDNEFPHPKHDSNLKLHSWWQEKQAKEFDTAQNVQSTAASAVSVTAALVATASYVGPLQPPLGYSDRDPTGLQLGITAVKVFIVCDTMSFYLAIAAIIAALVPCLPMPQQSMISELYRTRHMINVAVAMLFPSVICVLMAFAASSIAVIQTNQTGWNWGGLTIGTASVGGFFCLIMIGIFSIRVLAIIFHGSRRITKLYETTSFEHLVYIVTPLSFRIRHTIRNARRGDQKSSS